VGVLRPLPSPLPQGEGNFIYFFILCYNSGPYYFLTYSKCISQTKKKKEDVVDAVVTKELAAKHSI